jgi:hypothetical protein
MAYEYVELEQFGQMLVIEQLTPVRYSFIGSIPNVECPIRSQGNAVDRFHNLIIVEDLYRAWHIRAASRGSEVSF